ncbi:class I SAM-dependent methyltransferase [Shewanella maritima]|uniref:class I SAM-dependent methyltransferase n=1 Tax=Shewanella maritima TaxID=2520507 RepID=UPI003736D21E
MGSAQQQSKHWGARAIDWAELQEMQHVPLWNAMLSACGVNQHTKLLDVGCGGGGACALARTLGAQVVGIDATPELIHHARDTLHDVTFDIGDIERLPYLDNQFDVVFAANIIQYAQNHHQALSEFKRVCKPGGWIVAGLFASPDKVAFSAVLSTIRNALPTPPQGGGPFELSINDALERLFKEAGLMVVKSAEVNCPFIYRNCQDFYRATLSAGPAQNAIHAIGEQALINLLELNFAHYQSPQGDITITPNMFKFICAKPR